jgi:hypothetical protein
VGLSVRRLLDAPIPFASHSLPSALLPSLAAAVSPAPLLVLADALEIVLCRMLVSLGKGATFSLKGSHLLKPAANIFLAQMPSAPGEGHLHQKNVSKKEWRIMRKDWLPF